MITSCEVLAKFLCNRFITIILWELERYALQLTASVLVMKQRLSELKIQEVLLVKYEYVAAEGDKNAMAAQVGAASFHIWNVNYDVINQPACMLRVFFPFI